MRPINGIIVHCTATRAEWWADRTAEEKMEECRRWHVDGNGWSDIGYHYLIDRDGTVTEGRPIAKAGAHAKGHNSDTIGIALWGGHGSSEKDQFHEHFTADQEGALRKLIARIHGEYGPGPVDGHNQFSAKACPGFHVPSWFARKPKKARDSMVQSKTLQANTIAKIGTVATPIVAAAGWMPWQNLAIIGLIAAVVLIATGVIDVERIKKWKAGDR